MWGVWPRTKEVGYRVGTVAFPAVYTHLNYVFHHTLPPLFSLRIKEVQKRAFTMPPMNNLAIIKQVALILSLLINTTILINNTSNPQNNFNIPLLEPLNHALHIRKQFLIPFKIIITRRPSRVNIKTTDGN